jgi:hypothetical protein
MFWPQGGCLAYSLISLLIIFPMIFHNALNTITTSFDYKYPLMRVHTSHRCYKCPPFMLHSRQWAHRHPWCNLWCFYCHCMKCWLPCGMKHNYMCFLQPHSTLLDELTLRSPKMDPNWCYHRRSNMNRFTLSIFHDPRICCFESNSNQRKELSQPTPH